jgi:hypothetical protein
MTPVADTSLAAYETIKKDLAKRKGLSQKTEAGLGCPGK